MSGPAWRAFAGLCLSATLLALYSRGGIGFLLGFVALVPWLLTLGAMRTLASAALGGWAMSIAFVAAVLPWFGMAIGAYTGYGSAAGLLALLLAAPVMQPQIIAFAMARQLAARHHGPALRALAGASAWVATEWLAPKLLGDTLGHGLYPSTVLRQFADVGGAAGLSFLLILVNECVVLAITRRRSGPRASLSPLAVAASLAALMAGYGVARIAELSTAPAAGEKALRIGMVQSNIVDYERLRGEMGAYQVVRHVLDTHYAMSREAIDRQHVDALLWSETVYPTTFTHPKSEDGAALDREILAFVTAAKVPLVFGTYDVDPVGEYNAAAFVEPNAGTLGFYRKTNLFPFTERVPPWLDGPTLRRRLPWTGSWTPGSGARVFPLRLADGREVPVLPMICLDDVAPSLAIDGARLGAQVILTLSNDSWFTEHPVGAELHLAVAAFRSIETRLPQMRVTNNGISAVIDATGAVVARTSMGRQELLVGDVLARDPPGTLMVAWGDWVGRAGLGFLLLMTALACAKTLRLRAARGKLVPAASNTAEPWGLLTDLADLPGAWRASAIVLRLFACAGMLWMTLAVLSGDPAQTNPVSQIRMFGALVMAPWGAAWAIRRAFPGSAIRRRRIDHPAIKFLLFPWVPALPAFRLHQHIAFGGTFGEYYTFGLQAYLTALFIWWASWAIGLVLLAAALRAIVQAGTLMTGALRPGRMAEARTGLEWLGRLLYYVGVPAWLLLRTWP